MNENSGKTKEEIKANKIIHGGWPPDGKGRERNY